MPILAVAVGLYLPLELDTSIFIGGLLAWAVNRYFKKNQSPDSQIATDNASKAGLLLASGLITGEALMGILIAVGIVVSDLSQLQLFDEPIGQGYLGLAMLGLVTFGIYRAIIRTYQRSNQNK